jgi:hypothetical protein
VGAAWAEALAEKRGRGCSLLYRVEAQMEVGKTRKVVL